MKKYNFEHMVPQEPIVTNRFIAEFLDKEINLPGHLVQKISLPKFSNGEWEEMSMELLNFISCSTIIELNKIINKFDAKYNIDIRILDPVGQVTGTWHLMCQITGIDFGDFNYGSKDDSSEFLISKVKFKILECKFEV